MYDSANQLIRENNQAGGFTHVWTYDDAGNILSRKEYAYTTGALGTPTDTVNYIYGDSNWGDKLTAYDGKTITYDAVGNPLSDGTWTYTWRHGRELSAMTNGTITVRNSYNPDGARIAKIVNRSNGSETHRYTYNGGKLVYDIIRINKEGTISNLTILMSYDESGRPFMITYANVSYYYLLNAQGDVVGIMNVSGDIMVEYTYDAWGNVLSITGPMASTMGQHNQLRYRGCVYDPETGLYFLNSRFYDPEKGRFINADVLVATGQGMLGNNMFAYCRNNPVNRIDIRGYADTAIEEEFDDDIEPHPPLPEGGGYSGGTTPIAGAPGGGSTGYGGTAGGNGGISGGGTGYGGGGNSGGGNGSGGTSGAPGGSVSPIPQYAWDTLNYIKSHNGSPPRGYKGGKPYANDGRNGTQILPDSLGPFREYDVHPKIMGQDRGMERIIMGNGVAWYTPDHYMTFFEMR